MIRRIYEFALDLLFPVRCVACGAADSWLCESCCGRIHLKENQVCPVCKTASLGGRTHSTCQAKTNLAGLRVACEYSANPELAAAIKSLKYKFHEQVVAELGATLAASLAAKSNPEIVISFVPLHARRQRERGFNQAELLAREVAQRIGSPVELLLIRAKYTTQQAKLARAERLTNLAGAFAAAPGKEIAGKRIVLVDDIATTCSTLEACAAELKKAGAKEVWGLVLARN